MGRNRNGQQSSGKTEWETPPALVAAVAAELGLKYGFELDPAARADKVKAQFYFGPDQEEELLRDGLAISWFGTVFLNPPYGRGIGKWAAKAHEEVLAGRCELVAALLPNNSASRWWHRHVMECTEMWMLDRRVRFVGEVNSAPFDNVIIVWRAHQLGRRYLRGFGWRDVRVETETAAAGVAAGG